MSSIKGREKRFARHLGVCDMLEERSRQWRLADESASEKEAIIPGRLNPTDALRGEFLASVLASPELRAAREQGGRSFGIIWKPYSSIANGPRIEPFARIFDRFVRGCWTVSVVMNIDGLGNPGWLFERG